MKTGFRSRRCVLALAVGFLLNGFATAEQAKRLRVLSYNIHHAEGLDGELDLERIAGVIRSANPDLVALQEVDNRTHRTNRVDQPAELSRLTDMRVIFGKNIDLEGGEYGNAVLSKLPIRLRENLALPSIADIEPTHQQEQRGALAVEVDLASGAELLFVATHLDHRSQDRERFESSSLINRHFARAGAELPTIIAGDFNATLDSRVMKQFATHWQRAGLGDAPTVPANSPRRQIDYILFRPADRWRVIEVRVLDEPVASDHRPILAVLELLPAERTKSK